MMTGLCACYAAIVHCEKVLVGHAVQSSWVVIGGYLSRDNACTMMEKQYAYKVVLHCDIAYLCGMVQSSQYRGYNHKHDISLETHDVFLVNNNVYIVLFFQTLADEHCLWGQ